MRWIVLALVRGRVREAGEQAHWVSGFRYGFQKTIPKLGRRCRLIRFEMKPFLKWPGGKRWLVSKYSHLFPEKFETYIEPSLGSGSVLFYLLPQKAILGDANSELITTYSGLRDDPSAVEDALLTHEMNHCGACYYGVREECQ